MTESRKSLQPERPPATVDPELRQDLEDQLSSLVQNKQLPRIVDRVTAVVSQHTFNESKLPSAFELGELESVLPGAAERAISMAEREQEHQQDFDRRRLRGDFILDIVSPIVGLIGLTLFVGFGVFLVTRGQPVAAATGVFATIIAGIALLVGKRWASPKGVERPKSEKPSKPKK